MNKNVCSCKMIKFEPVDEIAENTAEFADEYFEVTAVNYTDDGKEQMVGYKTSFDDEKMKAVAALFGAKLPDYQVEVLEEKDWLAENVIKFAPFEAGNFLIYGSHEKSQPKSSKIPVMVYAATAFGSEHQTTKMCLEAASFLFDNRVECKNVLDIGTGSGILAIAAAKQWKGAKVKAVDIDAEAVRVCAQNAADNGVAGSIETYDGDGYKLPQIEKCAPYDLIFANILARPLIAMAKDMSRYLKKGGFGIISGFVEDQLEWVVSEHEKFGLNRKKVFKTDNWHTVILEKM